MAEFPYTTVPGKLSELLGKIQTIGVPDKVTTKYLPTIGFGSKNDRSLIPVLKFAGLLTEGGEPTQVWTDFRGPPGGRALGDAVQKAYAKLFQTYPEAQNLGKDELETFFRGHSSYGAQAVGKAVATFKALCQHAEFGDVTTSPSGANGNGTASNGNGAATAATETVQVVKTQTTNAPSLHIDIQVHISPESTQEQIEQVFKSMSKHLYNRD